MKQFYSVAFRVPFQMMGRIMYINGSARSAQTYRPGTKLMVFGNNAPSTGMIAEVVECHSTKREADTYEWTL